jgi:hypothetical protein
MSKFAIGEQVDNAADDHEGGTIIAVFPTVDGNFRYAVDMEGYGALQFFSEEKLIVHLGQAACRPLRPTDAPIEKAAEHCVLRPPGENRLFMTSPAPVIGQ